MYGIFHEKCPPSIKQIMKHSPSHNYQTRTRDLRKPKIRLTPSAGSLAYVGPSVWNKLPNGIKKNDNFRFWKTLGGVNSKQIN